MLILRFDGHGIFPILRLLSDFLVSWTHHKSFSWRRTYIGTVTATSTIQGTYLNAIAKLTNSLANSFLRVKTVGCGRHFRLIQKEGTNGSMGTDVGTLIALDAFFNLPFRHLHRNSPF